MIKIILGLQQRLNINQYIQIDFDFLQTLLNFIKILVKFHNLIVLEVSLGKLVRNIGVAFNSRGRVVFNFIGHRVL
jgi:hypothetical protein